MKTVLSIIGSLLLIPVFLLFLVLLSSAFWYYKTGVLNLPWFQKTVTNSMEPTYPVGSWTYFNPLDRPVIGDVVSFQCVDKEKCVGTRSGDSYWVGHRLVSIDPNGCMHIEGDNQPDAWDTRDYGCLMPDEIEIRGVVHKVSNFDK